METKTAIRQTIKDKKATLSPRVIAGHSLAITNRLIEYQNWQATKFLHIYQTLERLREVDTKPFIDFIKKEHQDVELYHPESKPPKLDVVIVPLVAFDERGYRVGHGGGYYDRFLKKYPQAKKIGLAFELQKVIHVPAEPHDVALDAVVTEDKVYTVT